ncbi:Phage shock protein PspC (stress-responsive transcriptional regulator) [Actinopolymorpha cephalotaxi]|uniref:Phage shock protein PspC (Stress-responsive transcriptional regulator) n=1 Tax=Actinopolymorpha cephalotaxi TaxID=504797 RepID=A0A1I2KZS7_9ACTN|nr:PspC domain-containing protein [Actinopolymorpha cephalotaxi]NYH84676.1 phage shock protein PspC (stress-responsive transcriptional regulator) [Actinopolymorpha cephalotaxi]SFF70561.1 Phage shock protein PspC (stress-responsive transcriptional regulator) [Actinopolymorpha cephalotaxi]
MADTTPPAEGGDPAPGDGVAGASGAAGASGGAGASGQRGGPTEPGESGTAGASDASYASDASGGSGISGGTAPNDEGGGQDRDESESLGRDDRDARRTDGMVRDLRRLHRSDEGRVVGGVCAGLGRELQVDPVLLRVVLAVLAPFGGVGLLLYAAGWVLIPRVGEERSILEQQLGRRRDGKPDGPVFVAGLVVIGLVVVSIPWWGLPWHVPALLVLSVLGLVALLRRQSDRAQAPDATAEAAAPGTAAPPSGPVPPGGGVPADATATATASLPVTEASRPVVAADAPTTAMTRPLSEVADNLDAAHAEQTADAADDSDSHVTRPLATTPSPSAGEPASKASPGHPAEAPGPQDHDPHTRPLQVGSWRAAQPTPPGFWDQPDPLGLGGTTEADGRPGGGPATRPESGTPAVPPPAPPRRRRFVLFLVTMLTALLVCAALAGLQENSRLPDGGYAVTVPAGAYVAAMLAVVGLGLIVGTWFGRSRGLIAVGTVLAVALVPVTAADFDDIATAHEHRVRPTSLEQVRRSYDYPTGQVRLDLTRLPLRDGQEVHTSVDLGSGELVVRVPPRVDVHLDADVGLGRLRAFDRILGGAGNTLKATDLGTDGKGGGDLWLEVDLGAGDLKVNRG